MMIILAITGWLAAAFLALGLYSCRGHRNGWRKLYGLERERCRELEHTRVCAEMNADRLKWLSDEHTRLTLKCDAICSQIRRMKQRGNATCQVNPVRHF